jgi:hypothetical protein
MTRRALSLLMVIVSVISSVAAEREWQKGVWREVSIERPRVSVGIVTGDPNNRTPQPAAARERRKYVIETATHRFELQQDTTADRPRVDAEIGEPVVFAVEKKNLYVKDAEGREHRFAVTKQSLLVK